MAKGKALELSIRIAGQVDKSLMSAISQTQRNISGFSKNLSRIGTAGLATMGAIGAGAAVLVKDCANLAAEYENNLKGPVKYLAGLADETGKISDKLAPPRADGTARTYAENYGEVYDNVLRLSTQIPKVREELTDMVASLGQSGFSMDEIFQYNDNGTIGGMLKDVATVSSAWDMTAEEVGNTITKWQNTFTKGDNIFSHEDVMNLADQINYLGANNATTAAEIANVVNTAGSLGQIAGVNPTTTAALAASVLSSGINDAKAGTSLNRIYTNISKGTSATKAQKEMWEEMGFTAEGIAKSMQVNPNETLIDVFGAIQNLPDERRVAALSTLFGQWAIGSGANLAGNMDLFVKNLEVANDPSLYAGSMERELNIANSTPEAVRMMRDNAFEMMKINFGKSFVPVQKQWDDSMRNLFLTLNDNMPELSKLSGTLADLASQGISKLSDALEKALPYVQKALDYVSNNGDKVIKVIGGIAATFAGMKAAPLIETLLGGAGSALFGSKGASGKRSGGLLAGIAGLFTGGQAFAGRMGTGVSTLAQGARLGAQEAGGRTGGIMGILATIQNWNGLFSGKRRTAQAANANLLSTLRNAGSNGGLGGMLTSMFAGTAAGKYLGGLGKAIGGVKDTVIGGFLGGGLSRAGGFAAGALGAARNGIGGLISTIGATGPGQMIGGALGKVGGIAGGAVNGIRGAAGALSGPLGAVGGFAGSILNVAGTALGPVTSMFGTILSGALPIVGIISGIIAVFSILYDNLDGVRELIGNIFGDRGLAVFDTFKGGLDNVLGYINELFHGGLADALSGVREMFVGLFDGDAAQTAGQTFDSVVMILQSVLGVIGQIVDFANNNVKPIITEIFSFLVGTVLPVILDTFNNAAPIIAAIITNIGTAVMSVAQIIAGAIQQAMPVIEGIVMMLMNIGSVAIPALLTGFNVAWQGICSIIESIRQVFDGLITFITGVFTGNWSMAWEGVKQIFGGVFDALVTLCKTPINAVIALINKAIAGINGLGLVIPDWVPVLGGKNFSINIPEIPMLAKGGFTNGPSIAGEAGREAVISFQSGVRSQNISTWAKAGQMLGVDSLNGTELQQIDSGGFGGDKFTFAPQITIQGNADESVIDNLERRLWDMLDTWYEQKQRLKMRTAY